MPGQSISYRQRFSLWRLVNGRDTEVDGGPYYRDVAVEKAAEQLLRAEPQAPIWINREERLVTPVAGGHSGDVVSKWRFVECVWRNDQAPEFAATEG